MAKNNIEESQQQSQGITIGSAGNPDIKVTGGTQGPHDQKRGGDDKHIPNQEQSSASNSDQESRQGKSE